MDIGNQCNKHNAKIELQTRCYTSPILLFRFESSCLKNIHMILLWNQGYLRKTEEYFMHIVFSGLN